MRSNCLNESLICGQALRREFEESEMEEETPASVDRGPGFHPHASLHTMASARRRACQIAHPSELGHSA